MIQYFIVIISFFLTFLFFRKKKNIKLNSLIKNYSEDVFIISDFNCKNKINDSNKILCNKCNFCKIPNLLNLESLNDMIKMVSSINQNKNLNIILHTEGGESDVPDTLSNLLYERKGLVKIHIPSYAYSSGTMIALAGDEIYMNWYSTWSIDVQMDISHENDLEDHTQQTY